jgi:UDPglucose 6-dehydrogenase
MKRKFNSIGVIGAGRLGICFALLLEKYGYNVLVSDVREDYVNDLNKKIIKTIEPGVADLLNNAINFQATTDNQKIIKESEIIYTLVATPSLPDGSYDVSSVWQIVDEIKNSNLNLSGKAFVIGCTTNPGDCENFQKQLEPLGVSVYYNPEFIAQGSIISDLQNADMVLIGGSEGEHKETLNDIYNAIQPRQKVNINFMSLTSAEIVKIAINCFLTTKISFANMIGEVLTRSGFENEIDAVLRAIGSDSRIGSKYLNYGYGFGGPCLPRDNRSFAAYAKKLDLVHNIGLTTDKFNDEHAEFLKKYFIEKNKKNLPFAFHHITYKPGTDILTESQQFRLCCDLVENNYKVYVTDYDMIDTNIRDNLKKMYNGRLYFGVPNEEVFWIEFFN